MYMCMLHTHIQYDFSLSVIYTYIYIISDISIIFLGFQWNCITWELYEEIE